MSTTDTTTDDKIIEGAITEVKNDQALVTLDPAKYAAEAFEPFKKKLTAAKRAVTKAGEYDITTTAGMKQARELRAGFRDVRLGIENARKEAKAPVIEAGKKIDAVAKEMTEEVAPLEDKYDAQIKAEEQRKEDEKQRKIEEERVRVEAIENRIARIRDTATTLAGADSVTLAAAIEEWSTKRLEPGAFEEFLEPALTALNTTVDALRALYAAALAREAEQRRVEAERAELERLRAEKEAREKAEAEAAAERERAAQAERDAAAAREADLTRQLEELRAQVNAATPPPPVDEAKPEPAAMPTFGAPDSFQKSRERDDQMAHEAEESAAASVQEQPAAPMEPESWRPTDADIVKTLAAHYDEDEATVTTWLRGFAL